MGSSGDAVRPVREHFPDWRGELLSDEDLVDAVRDSEVLVRAAFADQLGMVAEAERRGLPTRAGARSVKSWLQELLHLSGSDAHTRSVLAGKLDPAGTEDGAAAELPDTAAALGEGAIGLDHARAISDGMRKLAPVTTQQEQAEAEGLLAGQARHTGPRQVRVLADQLRFDKDQDGAYHEEQQQIAARELHLGTGRDGMLTLHGQLDREAGAALRAVLEPLAKPHTTDNGHPDPRPAAKRNADALVQLLDHTGHHGGTTTGIRPRLVVTVGLQALQERIGGGVLEATGEPVSASTARRMACDAEVLPAVLGGHGQPLDLGRSQHTVPPHLRRALQLRDGSCAFPGCDRPPGASHAHHCHHWADGGPTALDNLVLLCANHHRLLHTHHWTARINLHGLPEFIPPQSVDPDQTARPGMRADIGELPGSA